MRLKPGAWINEIVYQRRQPKTFTLHDWLCVCSDPSGTGDEDHAWDLCTHIQPLQWRSASADIEVAAHWPQPETPHERSAGRAHLYEGFSWHSVYAGADAAPLRVSHHIQPSYTSGARFICTVQVVNVCCRSMTQQSYRNGKGCVSRHAHSALFELASRKLCLWVSFVTVLRLLLPNFRT